MFPTAQARGLAQCRGRIHARVAATRFFESPRELRRPVTKARTGSGIPGRSRAGAAINSLDDLALKDLWHPCFVAMYDSQGRHPPVHVDASPNFNGRAGRASGPRLLGAESQEDRVSTLRL